MSPADHDCIWRQRALELQEKVAQHEAQLAAIKHEMAEMQRRLLGPKSEKMPRISAELRKQKGEPARDGTERRRQRAEAKEDLAKRETHHRVPEAKRQCPKCGSRELRPLGEGRRTTVYEYVPEQFVLHEHVQETLTCSCGEYVVTAPGVPKVIEKGRYSASFMAELATSKCADSIPFYRLEKRYERLGIPIARSTMNELFHRTAELLRPLSDRLLAHVASSDIVLADETSLRVQQPDKCRNGFVWTFLAEDDEADHRPMIAYRFSPDRSGQTPQAVLGGTKGTLLVDAYTGYNRVTSVDGRQRAGCLAHVRRKFFDARATAPEAAEALELILDLYRVEHEAHERGIVRTDEHRRMRRDRSRAVMKRLRRWLDKQRLLHPPKSPIGRAVSYTLNNWAALSRFLDDVRLPLDNNASESALRVVALGRKNFLFVGSDNGGENLAGLYSLVATCEANEANPLAYLTDVLERIDTHPASQIDELLPHRWKPPAAGPPEPAT